MSLLTPHHSPSKTSHPSAVQTTCIIINIANTPTRHSEGARNLTLSPDGEDLGEGGDASGHPERSSDAITISRHPCPRATVIPAQAGIQRGQATTVTQLAIITTGGSKPPAIVSFVLIHSKDMVSPAEPSLLATRLVAGATDPQFRHVSMFLN